MVALVLMSCEKNANSDRAVEFIEKVKTGTFDAMFLPDFEPSDIPTLLSYRNDKTVLLKYPTNPVSSFVFDTVTVGIIALWTIESIRVCELNGDSLEFNRFPSLNPRLIDTANFAVNKFEIQDRGSKLYYNWWHQVGLELNEKLKINPLDGSSNKWK